MAYDRDNPNNAVIVPPPLNDDASYLYEFERFPCRRKDRGDFKRRRTRIAMERYQEYADNAAQEDREDREILFQGGSSAFPEYERIQNQANPVMDIFGDKEHILTEMRVLSKVLIEDRLTAASVMNQLYLMEGLFGQAAHEAQAQKATNIAYKNRRNAFGDDWALLEDVDAIDKYDWNYQTNPDVTLATSGMVDVARHPDQRPFPPNVGQYANDASWQRIFDTVNFVGHLTRLIRFVDKGNPDVLNMTTVGDHKHLPGQDLRLAWALQRCWIRALHYKSMVHWSGHGRHDYGWTQMQEILYTSLNLLHHEHLRVATRGRGPNPAFAELPAIRASVVDALRQVATDLTSTNPGFAAANPGVTDNTSILNWNMQPQRFATILDNRFNNLGLGTRLASGILNYSADFERRLDQEHIENLLISKVFIYEDEMVHISRTIGRRDYHPSHIYLGDLDRTDYHEKYYPKLRKIMQTHRQRRDYLLFQNVNYRKPWWDLWLVYDTNPGGKDEEVASAVETYIHGMKNFKQNPIPNMSRTSITQNWSVYKAMFPIMPLGTRNFMELNEQLTRDTCCLYCGDVFYSGTLLVRLNCRHCFHFVCLMKDWDHPRRAEYMCPTCRKGPNREYPWKLYDRYGVDVEVIDHWDAERRGQDDSEGDYIVSHPEQWDAYLPSDAALQDQAEAQDLDDSVLAPPTLSAYWSLENGLLFMSEYWDELKQGEPRSVEVEMSRRREERRRWDEAQRAIVANTGNGLDGLVPPPPPPDAAADAETQAIIQRMREQQQRYMNNRTSAIADNERLLEREGYVPPQDPPAGTPGPSSAGANGNGGGGGGGGGN